MKNLRNRNLTLSDLAMNHEAWRLKLRDYLIRLNNVHHNTSSNIYYAVMREETTQICNYLRINANLINREELLLAATVGWNPNPCLNIKYSLFKDGSPVWEQFHT